MSDSRFEEKNQQSFKLNDHLVLKLSDTRFDQYSKALELFDEKGVSYRCGFYLPKETAAKIIHLLTKKDYAGLCQFLLPLGISATAMARQINTRMGLSVAVPMAKLSDLQETQNWLSLVPEPDTEPTLNSPRPR